MNKKHIIFDIDGTLIDTEKAILKSLQDTLLEVVQKKIDTDNLKFVLGIPGTVALKRLNIQNAEKINDVWNRNLTRYADTISVFPGIEYMLKELKKQGYNLGIITSKSKTEYKQDFIPFHISEYFSTVICAEDTSHPKPSHEPMLEYMRQTGTKTEDVLYIGDSMYDYQCASNAGVEFGLALWGCNSVRHIYANYFFNTPQDILNTLNSIKNPLSEMPWLKWAMELQFIAQAGITYSSDKFDLERFERIREIAAEIISLKGDISIEVSKNLFCNETGFQTPKLDTRAAIFKDDKILLVKEKNGTWSLPGGWVDVLESIKSNTIKEVKEESGLDVVAKKLIALQDRNKHNKPVYPYGICKAFVLCEIIGGKFENNIETIDSAFWQINELPSLAEEKTNEAQIKMCFEACQSENWEVLFD